MSDKNRIHSSSRVAHEFGLFLLRGYLFGPFRFSTSLNTGITDRDLHISTRSTPVVFCRSKTVSSVSKTFYRNARSDTSLEMRDAADFHNLLERTVESFESLHMEKWFKCSENRRSSN